jgi:hypothetical protein
MLTKNCYNALILFRNTAKALKHVPQWTIDAVLGTVTSGITSFVINKKPRYLQSLGMGVIIASGRSMMLPKHDSFLEILDKIIKDIDSAKKWHGWVTSPIGSVAGIAMGMPTMNEFYAKLFKIIVRYIFQVMSSLGLKLFLRGKEQISFSMMNKSDKLIYLLGPERTRELLRIIMSNNKNKLLNMK